MKLKTLKDLDMYKTHKILLKREAIKWVKDYDNNRSLSTDVIQAWIKYFFNITEEDLK